MVNGLITRKKAIYEIWCVSCTMFHNNPAGMRRELPLKFARTMFNSCSILVLRKVWSLIAPLAIFNAIPLPGRSSQMSGLLTSFWRLWTNAMFNISFGRVGYIIYICTIWISHPPLVCKPEEEPICWLQKPSKGIPEEKTFGRSINPVEPIHPPNFLHGQNIPREFLQRKPVIVHHPNPNSPLCGS